MIEGLGGEFYRRIARFGTGVTMNAITRLNTSPPVTRSTAIARSQNVEIRVEVRRQSGAETEIATKTTTSEQREITKTQRQLESETGAANADTGKTVSLEETKRYAHSLANAPTNQKGNLLNTIA